MALAFHPTHCVHYKVVCVRALDSPKGMFQIEIYSPETMKWKVCIESFSACGSEFFHPVYWNGSVHWAPVYLDNNFFYLKLDVEELQMLPAPEELESDDEKFDNDDEESRDHLRLVTMYFGESRDHLHLIARPRHVDDRILQLNVYEMLRDRSGWFLKYRVKFCELLGFPYMVTYSRVVDVIRGKEEEETFLVVVTPGKVMRYNVYDKSFNPIYSLTDDDFNDDTSTYTFHVKTLSCHRYIEALYSF
ncbi:F-box protein At5g07610-like [Bidens hawaiensis]|uniref:F-box protein At5g07610-like n=1 Tax=Bidens hawaiensis TaxID=980011 RepID=UPI0040490BAF